MRGGGNLMRLNGPTLMTRLGVLVMSTVMLVTFIVPLQAQEAEASSPCPHYAIQDVFGDPNGNWDGDLVRNSDELYNGLNPCIVDTGAFCAGGGNSLCLYPTVTYTTVSSRCAASVNAFPNGDYDGDGISNYVEVQNYADPCKYPCPNPTNADLALNPNGSWDNDNISNAVEVNQGTNPCDGYQYNPCPYYSDYDVRAMPGHDWDGDGISNSEEVRRGYHPCKINIIRNVIQVQRTDRLPHVVTNTVHNVYRAPVPKAVAPVCPAGYPYYHRGNGLCYTTPVGYGWR